MPSDFDHTSCLETAPVPQLIARVRLELSAEFKIDRPLHVSYAPGTLDVMGGIAEYTGSLAVAGVLDRGAGVALQPREDDQLQVFSFDRFDAHQAFTLRVPMSALRTLNASTLRREFAEPNRHWAAPLAGCLHALHAEGFLARETGSSGLTLAVMNTVPAHSGLGSSAAIEVATMVNLVDHFGLRDKLDPLHIAKLCQRVHSDIVGQNSGLTKYITSCDGEPGRLTRVLCQPDQLQPPLTLPEGITLYALNGGARRVDSGQFAASRCAAFMGHAIILHQMGELGSAAGATLTGDPMGGYLARLDPDDYKKLFRPSVPEQITGRVFLDRFGPTLDQETQVDPDRVYAVQHATDHHVLEARRVRRFGEAIEAAATLPLGPRRKLQLDRAGHLMYASHQSYTMDAMLGSTVCDQLVAAVRANESAGLYGARITASGSGGAVAVLADDTDRSRATLEAISAANQPENDSWMQISTARSATACKSFSAII